jgi:pimeloyl-[acyl-carrier protein] methyl ester esterase
MGEPQGLRICLLPGLDGSGRMFAPLVRALQVRGIEATVIAYPCDRVLDYSALVTYVLERLPRDRGSLLLAESFSGPVALQAAAAEPDRCAGLVLSTSFASSPLPWLKPLAPLLRWAPAQPPMALLSWLLLGRWSAAPLRFELAACLAGVKPGVLRARAQAALRVDVRATCAGIRLPVLNLIARADRLLGAGPARALGVLLPQTQSVELEGPHLLLQARPEACADSIAGFAIDLARQAT